MAGEVALRGRPDDVRVFAGKVGDVSAIHEAAGGVNRAASAFAASSISRGTDALRATLAPLFGAVSAVATDRAEVSRLLSSYAASVEDLQTQARRISATLQSAESSLRGQYTALSRLDRSTDDYTVRARSMTSKVADLGGEVSGLQSQLRGLDDQRRALDAHVASQMRQHTSQVQSVTAQLRIVSPVSVTPAMMVARGPVTAFIRPSIAPSARGEGMPDILARLLAGERLTMFERVAALAELLLHPEYAAHITDPETARWYAGIVAAQVRGLDAYSSEEDVVRATALLEASSGNGLVSEALIDELGVEGLMVAFVAASDYVDRYPESGRAFAESLRAVAWAGEAHMSESDARRFAGGLVDYISNPIQGPSENIAYMPDPYALSYLLDGSSFSTAFLGEFGNRLDAWEPGWVGSDGGWGPWGGQGAFRLFDTNNPSAYDPACAYMEALGRNEDAAFQFFTGTGSQHASGYLDEDQAWARQQYWIQDRSWGHDGFNGITAALDAATTGPSILADPERKRDAAALFSVMVELFSKRADGKSSDGEAHGFASADDNILLGGMSLEASHHLLHAMGVYMPAVDHWVNVTDGNPPNLDWDNRTADIRRSDLGSLDHMPRLHTDYLRRLMQAVASSDGGDVALLALYVQYQHNHFIDVPQRTLL